ncbi:unnamed protein product, partial [Ectocarpus sp. 8 AP-2014]
EPEVTDGGAVSGSASAARSAILAAGSTDSSGGASSSSARSGSRPASKGKGKGTRDTAGRGTRGYLDEELAERNNRHLAALSGEQGTAKRKQRPWHPNDMFTAYDAKRSQERNKLLDMLVEKALRGRQVKRRRDLELERQEIALRKAEIWSKQRPRRDTTNHRFALHRAGRLDESQLKAAILADLSPELRKVIEACEQDEGRAGGGAGSPT